MQTEETEKKTKRGRKVLCWLLGIILPLGAVFGGLQLGCMRSEKAIQHFTPDYAKIDLRPLLEKAQRTDEEYETLYRQTGLTRLGIDGLIADRKAHKIVEIQRVFFKKKTTTVDQFAPFTYDYETDVYMPMAKLEDGDIIVTSTTWFSWWRYGHAALVVDGEHNEILESISPGTVSKFNKAQTFQDLADFMILRPKADAATKTSVVEYAKSEMVGIPYRLTVGILSKKYKEDGVKGTHCAHLVWYAYKRFGIDLDSTGGGVVKPRDMALSDKVDLVQAYGFDLDGLWG